MRNGTLLNILIDDEVAKYLEKMKDLYLIRHAESENNVDKREARGLFGSEGGGEWKFPTMKQLGHVINLLKVDMDSPLSANGIQMVEKQREILNEADFLNKTGIELILYSHLNRAKATCNALFSSAHNVKIEEHPLLFEKDLKEHVYSNLVDRVDEFKRSLLQYEESRVVLVGHAGFFQCLVGTSHHLANCEVYHCILNKDGTISEGNGKIFPGGLNLLLL